LLLCSLLAVLGVIVLRFTRPEITRLPGLRYPIPPVGFDNHEFWMMFYLFALAHCGIAGRLGNALSGLLLYFCAQKRR